MPPDFTLTKFRAFATAVAENYRTLTLSEYFSGAALPLRFAIMRHDIGRRARRVLFTVRIEQEFRTRY